MNKKLLAAAVLATLIMIVVVVSGVGAQAQEPIDLQPTYRLMNGEEEMGLVYGLDYGWLVLTESSLLFTCGCEEDCDVRARLVETAVLPTSTGRPGKTTTVVPTKPVDTPTPEDTPTLPPSTTKCNRGIGNDSEGCDPGNSSGQGQGVGRAAGEDRDEHKKDK